MDLVLLAGNSLNNKSWIEEVSEQVKDLFQNVRIQYYKHWETGDKLIDFDKESEELPKTTQGLNDYIVFAKSAGTILTLKGIEEGLLTPKACVFCGFPLGFAQSSNSPVGSWIPKIKIPLVFIQNTKDPVLGYQGLVDYLESLNLSNCKTIETPGETHDYEDYVLIRNTLKELIANN